MQRSFTIGFLVSSLLAGGPAVAAGKPGIPLCFERQEVLPWRTLDGGGLNFELLNEVARRTGVEFDYQSMPWKRCLAQLKANQVGGAFGQPIGVVTGAKDDGDVLALDIAEVQQTSAECRHSVRPSRGRAENQIADLVHLSWLLRLRRQIGRAHV